MALADTPPVEHHAPAGIGSETGEVDAGDHRPGADDGTGVRDGQPVFVIDRGVFDVDDDTLGQHRFVDVGERGGDSPRVVFLEQQCTEHPRIVSRFASWISNA